MDRWRKRAAGFSLVIPEKRTIRRTIAIWRSTNLSHRRRETRSILELSINTGYDDAMPHLPSGVHVLPLTVGILTGCTTLVTTYDRLRASLSEPEIDDTIHLYGAWFLALSNSSRLSTAKSLGLSLQSPEAHGKPNGGCR
jgi:hypothetical protein